MNSSENLVVFDLFSIFFLLGLRMGGACVFWHAEWVTLLIKILRHHSLRIINLKLWYVFKSDAKWKINEICSDKRDFSKLTWCNTLTVTFEAQQRVLPSDNFIFISKKLWTIKRKFPHWKTAPRSKRKVSFVNASTTLKSLLGWRERIIWKYMQICAWQTSNIAR